jgi:hypothetical protein
VERRFRLSHSIIDEGMIRKSGNRFPEKIMLKQGNEIAIRFHLIGSDLMPDFVRKSAAGRHGVRPCVVLPDFS